jgi:MFS family permease
VSSTVRTLQLCWQAGSAQAQAATTPRDDLLSEVEAEPGVFLQAEGPFVDYRREVSVEADDTVSERIDYRLHIPWFGWVFRGLMHRHLARGGAASSPVWAPPDRLNSRQVMLLGLLAAASLSATFSNTLFTQTATFAADSFGKGTATQSLGGVVVRLGIVVALPFTLLADRVGRRRMLVAAAWLAPICCAAGAVAPTWWTLVATQAVGRPIAIAMFVLIGVVLSEEMPRNSRAFALSLMALAGGMGASVAVGSLLLAGLGDDGWRFVYVITLVWLSVAVALRRALPETDRFEHAHQRALRHPAPSHIRWNRFGAVASVAVLANVFVAPASFLQNDYLKEVRGMSAAGVTLFTFCTVTPSSLGLLSGGYVADRIGRRWLLAVCMPLSTLLLVASFTSSGSLMWMTALGGGMLAGLAYPAFIVYRGELFPTGNRSSVNGWITALSLAGSSAGLVLVGQLVDRGWSYGSSMALVALGQVAAAVIAVVAYPETAHLELEQLNPEDSGLLTEPLEPSTFPQDSP